jgi:hypothetical protein
VSEELQEVTSTNLEWYRNLQYEDAKGFIQDNINNTCRSFVAIGYYLKYIRDNQMYINDGYESIWEFAQAEFGISKSQASKFMSINDRFSKDGNSPVLMDTYKDFSSSKLSEMLYLSDEQLEQVTVGTTVAQIREIKQPEKKNTCIIKNDLEGTDLKCSGLEGKKDCLNCDKAEVVSTSKQEPKPKKPYYECAAYQQYRLTKGCKDCFYDKPENNCPYDRVFCRNQAPRGMEDAL